MSTNEAAERLRSVLTHNGCDGHQKELGLLDEAIAEALAACKAEDEIAVAAAFQAGQRYERRATVERIRGAIERDHHSTIANVRSVVSLHRILDEVADAPGEAAR